MKEFIGKVWEREIDYGCSIEFVPEVSDEKDNRLSELLDEMIGKKIKITIEEI